MISSFDRRFEYRYGPLDKDDQQWLAKVRDPEKRSWLMHELHAKQDLERLEKAVREYIAWARSQGLR